MIAPALYTCLISHRRHAPVRHAFTYRTYLWLVDLDKLPELSWPLRALARFEARDHLGDPDASIRANVDAYLAEHGVDLAGGRVLMLGNARVLGYVFNPITLFWCYRGDGELACVIAEVHNTYGGRHRYLLHPDQRGRADVAKQFYVSPFFAGAEGAYRMWVPDPGDRLAIGVALRLNGRTPFVASLRGSRRPLTVGSLLGLALRHPWVTAAATAWIRVHGVWLFLRGLPVHPRPQRSAR